MAKDLGKFFRNPPKGGNERGVATHNPMSPDPKPLEQVTRGASYYGGGVPLKRQRELREVAKMTPEERSEHYMNQYMTDQHRPGSGPNAQTSLRTSFEAGEDAARDQKLHSSRSDQPEMRNFDRGRIATQTPSDPSAVSFYDYESEVSGSSGRVTDGFPAGPNVVAQKPTPVINPDTTTDYRTDGKPYHPMPRDDNASGPNFVNGARQDGVTRDNPAHILGRNPGKMKYGKGGDCD